MRDKHVNANVMWRMSEADRDLVQRLATLWGCNQAEALRTSLRLAEAQVKRARS